LVVIAACGRVDFDDHDAAAPDAPEGECPDGYLFVRGSATLGTSDFCAMRFEARARGPTGATVINGCVDDAGDCVANGLDIAMHTAISVPAGLPWRGIDAANAYAECLELGAGYALMTNAEWMTIARAAELTAANWSGGEPYAGRLPEGHTDGAPIAVSDPEDPYSDTGNSAEMGWEQRRTIVLPNGAWIWDLSGHMQEWIDWTYGDDAYAGAPACTGGELDVVACAGYTDDDYRPANHSLDSSSGAGYVIGGSGDAARRGGQTGDAGSGRAGIYALNMNRFTNQTFPGTGFRCVYRLP
jgi:hypothetical protein